MILLRKWRLLSAKERVLAALLWVGGLAILTLGVVLTINGHLGAGGVDAMNFAMAERLGVNTSVAIYITGVVSVALAALVRRGRPNVLAFGASLVMGLFTDLWKQVLAGVQGVLLWEKILIFAAGLVCIALAVALTMCSVFPGSPVDDLLKAFVERGKRASLVKILIEGFCGGIAYLLGGELGLGTLLVVFGLGPMIDLFRTWLVRAHLDVDGKARALLAGEGEGHES